MSSAKPNSCDKVSYPKMPHRKAHPRPMEAIATLFGMGPASILNCRVLELGCASGSNLIPQAQDMPDSQFLGIDLSQKQIDEGRKLIKSLGLKNIELRQANIMDIDASWGQFDYIVTHGVYSWVPPQVQDKILSISKVNLAPQGVALVSYNVFPGWHFRGTIRDMMVYHVSQFDDPQEKIAQSRSMLDFTIENCRDNTAYGNMLKEEVELVRKAHDNYLYHEYLEENNWPVYFHEFAENAQSKGLQYLGESTFCTMLSTSLSEKAPNLLRSAPLIRQEQYMDFVRNRSFRSTLICHAEVAVNRKIHSNILEKFHVVPAARPQADNIDVHSNEQAVVKIGGGNLGTTLPMNKAAMVQMQEIWPRSISTGQLHKVAMEQLSPEYLAAAEPIQTSIGTLKSYLMAAFTAGMLEIYIHPPRFLNHLSQRPVASPLVRRQAAAGDKVTNRKHETVTLDVLGRHILCRLDGHHDRNTIAGSVRKAIDSGTMTVKKTETQAPLNLQELSECIDGTLSRIFQSALLIA